MGAVPYTMGAVPYTMGAFPYTTGAVPFTTPPNSNPGPSNSSTMSTSDHTALPRMWDAYAGFKVIARDSQIMRCIGTNTSDYNLGTDCGWWWSEQKIPDKYEQLRSLLNNLETKHPREAEAKLQKIASLSLCHHHQNQSYKFLESWRVMLWKAAQEYAGVPSLSKTEEGFNIEEWKVQFAQITSKLAAAESGQSEELRSRGDQIKKLIEDSGNLRSQLEEEKKVSQRLGSDLENAKQSNVVLSDEVKRHVAKMVTKIRSSDALKEEVAQLKTYNTILEDRTKALKEDLIEREELVRVNTNLKFESEKDGDGGLPPEQKAVTAEQILSIIEKSLQELRLDHAGSQSKLEEAMKAAAKKQEEMSVQIIALKQAYEVDLARLKTNNTALTIQNNALQAKLDLKKEEPSKRRGEMSISNDNLQDVKQDAIVIDERLKKSRLELTSTCSKSILGQVQSSAKAAFKWMWMATWKRRIPTKTQQDEGSPLPSAES